MVSCGSLSGDTFDEQTIIQEREWMSSFFVGEVFGLSYIYKDVV